MILATGAISIGRLGKDLQDRKEKLETSLRMVTLIQKKLGTQRLEPKNTSTLLLTH